jgi:type IV pilus assembly protein PilA
MKKVQAGFTLIELMIVVAIIGILAAIAIPQYQTYIAKSQVTRAMGEAGAVKTAIETCILNGQLTMGAGPGLCDPQTSASNILAVGALSQAGAPGLGHPQVVPAVIPNTGIVTIVATLGQNAAASIQGQAVTWTRSGLGSWLCTTPAAPAMPDKYKPVGCTT